MKKFFIFIFFLLLPLPAWALELVPACARTGSGGFCCALFLASQLARFILGIMGVLALLMFVYGGYKWITSAGAPEAVKKGQRIMTNTVIGIVVIVFAWITVNFIITSLAGQPKIGGMTNAWYEMCKSSKK